ncbi:excalibur calcium-binding domain-containing protein [Planosporangium thailandense]|uniref:Excalibur calcium-binding domain-containing protein n=1 Tax=Planosporangium thailandense TaxID=765197 RepID=A0ABX0Y3G5_9ACTN|nr:excalibur calcium-binding domain-containing protein [Planosporangium thailandense]
MVPFLQSGAVRAASSWGLRGEPADVADERVGPRRASSRRGTGLHGRQHPGRAPAANTGSSGGGSDVYYANCAAVRAAGKAPLHRGDPGYRSPLDRDNDGIACE